MDLTQFEGDWRLDRTIEDFASDSVARFDGTCRFLRDGAGLRQEERGVLRLASGVEMTADRVYLWRAHDDGIAVHFADGRFFHTIARNIGAGAQVAAAHWCDPDQYDVDYNFGAWPQWQATWRVTGPRKDYRSVSIFRPVA